MRASSLFKVKSRQKRIGMIGRERPERAVRSTGECVPVFASEAHGKATRLVRRDDGLNAVTAKAQSI